MLDRKLTDEHARLAALHRYGVLDTAPEQQFDKITSLVRSVLGVPISAVSLIDRDRQWFKSICGLETRETPRSVSFCSHAIRQTEPLIVDDALQDDRFKVNPLVLDDPNIRSYAGVPLQTPDGYNVGALCAIDVVPREFSQAQIEILSNLASLVVDELELRRIAERDHLTNALTRRGFVQAMDKEIARFHRHQRASALILFDIDHFKKINDCYGHPGGDAVLKAIVAACRNALRANDVLGRLGGEEFGIVLDEADNCAATAVAEKLRQTVEQLTVGFSTGIKVTASFGVAPIATSVTDSDEWILAADAALYSAKRGGRNQVVVNEQDERAAAA
ncbi:sensor domain-containing diguanylate cyclase [Sphingomonas kaistensis]|uniref:diguanylate cyclase n=1 Tax=Sphingomonas kaistensis TaxID=298708 RepID=A0ABZ2FWE0_9SPHN